MLRKTVRDAAAWPVWEISDPWGLALPVDLEEEVTAVVADQAALAGVLTFGASALALAAIVFPLLGLARVPTWASLIISALAGPALAPVVRKARNRRWHPLQRTLGDSAGPIGFQSD